MTDYSLTGELVNDIERARSVRGTGIVAEIQIIVFRQKATDSMKNGQTAIARIKYAYRTHYYVK